MNTVNIRALTAPIHSDYTGYMQNVHNHTEPQLTTWNELPPANPSQYNPIQDSQLHKWDESQSFIYPVNPNPVTVLHD